MAQSQPSDSEQRDELRTMAFRMREIQRMLAMRVAQENRRLEAEGLDPVEEPGEALSSRRTASRDSE